jgi:hypothetical protein
VTRWPVTIGRALDCDVVLHDPYAAPYHATLDAMGEGDRASAPSANAAVESAAASAGRGTTGGSDKTEGMSARAAIESGDVMGSRTRAAAVRLTVGASVNGVRLPDRRLAAGASAALPAGAIWSAGRSLLRVRLAGETLAAELPLAHPARRRHAVLTIAAAAAVLLWIAAALWLENDPGARWDKYVPPLLAVVLAAAGWCALWGLGSKLFQRRFRLMPHVRVLLAFVLAALLMDAVLSLSSFALSWPWLSHLRDWLSWALVAALLGTHASLLLPGHERSIALTFGVLCLLAIGIGAALNWRRTDRVFGELYAATLPPPSFRLVAAQPPAVLLDELRTLKARLDRRAKEDDDKEAPPGSSEEDEGGEED